MHEIVSTTESTIAQTLAKRFTDVRRMSLRLCKPLLIEDFGLQAAPEVSPPKWHLAHTTWFFETFILKKFLPDYHEYQANFDVLFNSYYQGVGPQYLRPNRGLLSRPTLEQVEEYRDLVDEHVIDIINKQGDNSALTELILLGINHEQQHQELLLTDIKFSFSFNPLYPTYAHSALNAQLIPAGPLKWTAFEKQTFTQGYAGNQFHFDNETPAHEVIVQPFHIANRLITNREYLQFIEDGGYDDPLLWLADGWQERQQQQWNAPLYWYNKEGDWLEFTLHGLQPLLLDSPVTHVSYYEADAYARWVGKKLPTEAQWELAKSYTKVTKPQLLKEKENYSFHPLPATRSGLLSQLLGSCWEWTQSAYLPYPGYQPLAGAVGEYNGKFMCNQMVLKGGSCVTPYTHIRSSYRNFFYPKDRWQFSGIRLVE